MSQLVSILQKIHWKTWLLRGLVLTFVALFALAAGMAAFMLTRRFVVSAASSGAQAGPQLVEGQPTSAASTPGTDQPGRPSAPAIEPELAPWDGVGRVTILLLGLDYRDWEAGSEYSRSDTMILLSLDPLAKTAGILSIPRDMWVAIPGFKHGKINTAYYLGDAYKLPGGGPGLAVKTVEEFLGVPINYYAQIDFGAFVRFIDEIGGVKIDVPQQITVDLLGSGAATKKTLQPGVQVLPGEWALAYARARYTEGGDFDRAKRQQQVILGIRDRILSLDMLPTIISKADVLYSELAGGVHTNLKLDDAIQLALLAGQIPDTSIHQGILNEKYVLFGTSPDNLAILIPIIDKIHVLRDEIFSTSGALSPLTPGTTQEQMIAEGAKISVQNASRSAGLGERTVQYLQSLGAQATQTADAEQVLSLTTIIDHTGNPYTLRYLVDLMGISELKIQYEYIENSPIDVELILGNDWAGNNNLP